MRSKAYARISKARISAKRWSGCGRPFSSDCRSSLGGRRALEKRERELDVLRERIARHTASQHFIARSEAMQEVLELAARVAPIDTTVLVYGESGTGKEFIVG
jgi:DNA-binding NtrC family response regulator